MDLLFGGVERQIAHVEGGRILQLVLRIRAGRSLIVVAASSALLLRRISISVGRVVSERTLAVAYELGLSRRSMVLLTNAGMMVKMEQNL